MATLAVKLEEVHQPSAEEIDAASTAARQLSKLNHGIPVSFIPKQPEGSTTSVEPITLPANIFRTLIKMLIEMGNGNAVAVVPVSAELTTQQAADLLNVSRPHLIKLIEQGTLNFRMVGTHRKLKAQDVLNYRDKCTHERRESFTKMAAIDEELGLLIDTPDEQKD